MPNYKQLGTIPPKRHIEHINEPGFKGEGIYYEEVLTTAGFGRAYSIAYHLRPPTRVRKVESAGSVRVQLAEQDVLRHHHLLSGDMPRKGDIFSGRVPLLTNSDVTLLRCRPAEERSELFRNASADEILFVHKGQGTLYTLFGNLPFKQYDYVVIPHCTSYRIEFAEDSEPDLLIVESSENVRVPGQYFNPDGQIKLDAPYSERDFR